MINKLTLTLLSLLLLVTLVSCKSNSTPGNDTSYPSSDAQANQGSTSPEASENDTYQMLPIISNTVAKLHLDASADGSTQQLAVGEVMAITLESNPSTGYGWFASSSNSDVLASMGEPEYKEPASSGTPMLGASGTQTFYFQASAAGNATITLDYKRGWETDVAPEKTITITVEVK